jgi:hypothetical protein
MLQQGQIDLTQLQLRSGRETRPLTEQWSSFSKVKIVLQQLLSDPGDSWILGYSDFDKHFLQCRESQVFGFAKDPRTVYERLYFEKFFATIGFGFKRFE